MGQPPIATPTVIRMFAPGERDEDVASTLTAQRFDVCGGGNGNDIGVHAAACFFVLQQARMPAPHLMATRLESLFHLRATISWPYPR